MIPISRVLRIQCRTRELGVTLDDLLNGFEEILLRRYLASTSNREHALTETQRQS